MVRKKNWCVQQLTNMCGMCNVWNQKVRRDTKLGTLNDSAKPNDIVGLDFIGPVSARYILAIIDFLSRRVQVRLFQTADGEVVL